MRDYITVTPARPSHVNGQRSISVNIKYIVSVGRIDDSTGVLTTNKESIITCESYDELVRRITALQE